jgi:hypothetical protein
MTVAMPREVRMAHFHSQEEARVFYLDQLCTIGLVGALGGVGFMMWWQGLLGILADQFRPLVLVAGIALMLLVIVRAATLWQSVGRTTIETHQPHGHEHHDHDGCCHDHGPDGHHHHDHDHDHDEHHHHGHDHGSGCDHAHEHPAEHATPAAAPAHDHDHGHDHGWSPWRYAVLLLPIFLYLMGLPNQGFSQKHVAAAIAGIQPENIDIDPLAVRGDDVLKLDFTELKQAAFLPTQRQFYEGKVGTLQGEFYPGANDNTCRLVRLKMICCLGDATFPNVMIISPEKLTGFETKQWVEVTGQIQFRKRKDRDEWLPVLQIKGRDQIAPANRPVIPNL